MIHFLNYRKEIHTKVANKENKEDILNEIIDAILALETPPIDLDSTVPKK